VVDHGLILARTTLVVLYIFESYIRLMAHDTGVAPATTFDLMIRGGTIVDGLGGEPFVGTSRCATE
jgi:hypothetical protein